MESMEMLVAHIHGLSGTEDELCHLHYLLKKAEDSLQSQATQLLNFLGQLDPALHSLGYLYLLDAYSSAVPSTEQANEFLQLVVGFIDSCIPEQIRLASDKFISVCKKFKDYVMQLQVPIRGVAPLKIALQKLETSNKHLCTLHADFLLLCLLAKSYKASLSVLENENFEVEQPKDLFLYCYYGGMLYIGLKRFQKALEHLHIVFTSPMVHLNAIAIEAYKKYILVSLILNGQVPLLPKYTSATVQRNLKNHAQVYVELVTSYETGKYSELEQLIQTNTEKFQNDNNMGLVKQLLQSLYKRNIQRLTQTYLTLSLHDIANIVQLETPKEAEMHVLRMIQDGEIFATINRKDGMVSFDEDPEQYNSCQIIKRIDSSIRRVMALSKKLSTIEDEISCDPTYVTKVGRDRARLEFDDFDSVPRKLI